jgi:hypothetical protein
LQAVGQAARRSALDAQAVLRKERVDRQQGRLLARFVAESNKVSESFLPRPSC